MTWNGQRIPLTWWRTTIGSWRSELHEDGRVHMKYKQSDVGPRVWKHIVAAPVWVPPDGTPAKDLLTRKVERGGKAIELQPREFALLEYLMRHAQRPVTKTMILEHIYDYSFDPQTNVVDVLVHRLRAKIDQGKAMIHTIRGVGYVLRPA